MGIVGTMKWCTPISLLNKADTLYLWLPDSCIDVSVGLEFGRAKKGAINFHPTTPQHVIFSSENFRSGQESWRVGAKIAHEDQVSGVVRALGWKVIVGQVDSRPGQLRL